MAQTDPFKALEEAGIPIDRLSPEEREVVGTLTPDEVEVLIKVHQKVDAAREVVGQDVTITGGVAF
jgi:hypothetical protein